jgi:hypothetical protein
MPGLEVESVPYFVDALSLSRITNDMLLGAIAASTGLWVIGITVTIGYLVITA